MDWRFLVRRTDFVWENEYELDEAEVVLLGVPFDSTTTGLPGTRLGPDRIREEFRNWASTYDPELGSLDDVKLVDIGNVDVVYGDPKATLDRTYEVVKGIIEENPKIKLITLGGEHSITFPIVKAMLDSKRKFDYLCFDAHWDLLDSYLGLKESHASVNRRISEVLGLNRMEIKGPRIGEKEEWDLAKKLGKAKDPVYLSVDLDVLDNIPVGTPVPGGWDFNKLWGEIKNRKIVSADIVEYDPMLGTNSTPSELLRRLILKMSLHL